MSDIRVMKRNGTSELFDIDKIHRVVSWAIEGINNVSISDIEINAKLNIKDGITTSEIHSVLIESAANLISADTPEYQYVAGRLLNYQLRKAVWGGKNPPKLIGLIKRNIEIGRYEPEILSWYSEDELNKLDEYINHDRDLTYTYGSIKQLCDKYLVKNRKTGQLYETPQFRYMVAALAAFHKYPKSKRLQYVKRAYKYFSQFKINLATPQLASLGTTLNSYSSCLLIEMLDESDSILATQHSIGKAVSSGYGIGINFGRMRGINSPIRGGQVIHPGVVPFLKTIEANTKAWQKNGIRGGSTTVNFPIWHAEIEDILQLKNANTGTHESRVVSLDYAIGLSRLFYQRFLKNEDITLFSPHDVPGLYDAFGGDEFDDLYVKYEQDETVPKKVIKARDLLSLLVKERLETGRIYIINIDNVNKHGAWTKPVYMTNLCVTPETLLLTSEGHLPIASLEGETVQAWNGKQWSKVEVRKTGTNQKILKVILSDGKSLECTEYHKWYIVKSYNDARRGKVYEKRTIELKPGDKLVKFHAPLIDGDRPIKYPYTHGFFCGDGTYEGSTGKRISLYGEKIKVLPYLDIAHARPYQRGVDRQDVVLPNDIGEKFDVPLDASIADKIKWFEGYSDADGSIARNGNNESLQITSVNLTLLQDVQLLLQTLGVQAKVGQAYEETDRLMPDGRGGEKVYRCQPLYRLLITSNGLYQLAQLGYSPKRLRFEIRQPQREASQFVTVVEVVDEGRYSDTYCAYEPLENKLVFNGILTGNCVEITQAIEPLKTLNSDESEIGVCVLSAINWLEINSEVEFEKVCDVVVRMLDEIIDIQDYFDVAAKNFCQKKRSLGIGVTNLAAFLAKNSLKYSDGSATELVDEWMEKQQYYLIKSSIALAREKGKCELFNTSRYSEGWLPIDKELSFTPKMDWESLRAELKEDGMRHTTLTAQMPCESSSVVQNATNGIEPVRKLLTYKSSKKSSIPFVVPFSRGNYQYEMAFNMPSNEGYLKLTTTMGKWMDMAMSVNQYFNPANYQDHKIPYTQILKELIQFWRDGGKCLYYLNTNDENTHFTEEDNNCSDGACTL